MKRLFKNLAVLTLLMLAACSSPEPQATPTAAPTPSPEVTPTRSGPTITTIRPPAPEETVQAYLEALQQDDFSGMYAMLSSDSQAAIPEDVFTRKYIDSLAMAAVATGKISFDIQDMVLTPENAQVSYQITWESRLFGNLVRESRMFLTLIDGGWKIEWGEDLVLPDLAGGNVLRRLYYPPADRGSIFDQFGNPMVSLTDAYAVGIVPSRIGEDTEADMLSVLARATGFSAEHIFKFYENQGYNYDFYIPITDVTAQRLNRYYNSVTSYDAVTITPFTTRYYLDQGNAAHVLGYTSFVQPEEQDRYMREGLWWTSRIARAGVELWGDSFLRGTEGGALFLDDAAGNQLEKLGEVFVTPSSSIYLTVDNELQAAAQEALFGLRGAVVVMEQDTGRILAMASSPTYSPNLFDPENTNSLFTSPFNDVNGPTINRAINGQYPLGSVFKIITMAAALETGEFTVDDTYECEYSFNELLPSGPILYDWTYARNLEQIAEGDDPYPPSGTLTLPQGLMRSCNPWFYHIGLSLYDAGLTTALSEMARGFGLGSPTGVIGLPNESVGQVLDPQEPLDATNLATGQGELLVTPLQVANFVNAVANGGTFYVPQIIETVVDSNENILYEFSPQISGELPVSAETLAEIQAAMRLVVQNSRGTAEFQFRNFVIDVSGKTGTAQTGNDFDEPHAWFAAFTNENRENKPDVVVVVIVENRGDGSEWAAPVARRVLESYYFDRPIRTYPWEIRIGVPEWMAFPEPEETEDDG